MIRDHCHERIRQKSWHCQKRWEGVKVNSCFQICFKIWHFVVEGGGGPRFVKFLQQYYNASLLQPVIPSHIWMFIVEQQTQAKVKSLIQSTKYGFPGGYVLTFYCLFLLVFSWRCVIFMGGGRGFHQKYFVIFRKCHIWPREGGTKGQFWQCHDICRNLSWQSSLRQN